MHVYLLECLLDKTRIARVSIVIKVGMQIGALQDEQIFLQKSNDAYIPV